MSTFGFKEPFLIVTLIDTLHVHNEANDTILSYLSITQVMVDSHCEIMWSNNSGAVLGRHPKANYGDLIYNPIKKALFTQQYLRYKILGQWIKNSLTTDAKHNLRAFRST